MITSSNQTASKLEVNLIKENNTIVEFEGNFDFSIIPQIIFNRIEKRIVNGFSITVLLKNLKQDGNSFWSINTFSPSKDQNNNYSYTSTSKVTYNFNAIHRVEKLYRIICKIEKHGSIQIAEKYLTGYLEERNKTLSQLIIAA